MISTKVIKVRIRLGVGVVMSVKIKHSNDLYVMKS